MKLEGKPTEDVFEKNPELLALDFCQGLISSLGKGRASKVFWALYLVYHPESTIFVTNIEEKKEQVMRNHMKSKKKFDKEFGHLVQDFIEEIVYDPIAKLLVMLKVKLDEYFRAIAYLDFEVKHNDDTNMLNQINNLKDLKGYDDEIEKYEKIFKKYTRKKNEGTLQKNTKESLREKRMRIGRH